jgi:regulator of protease activity HflC (stomatin/prohibitin superfamily)
MLIVPVAVASGLFSFFVVGMAIKARTRPVVTGAEEMIGAAGEILEDMEHEGWARIHGEQWRVRSNVPLKRGGLVRVRARHDLILDVEPCGPSPACGRGDKGSAQSDLRRVNMFEFGGITIVFVIVALLVASIRILREYERGVVFMLGRFWKVKGPGLIIIIPGVQQMVRVDLRTMVFDVPSQDVISRDNVSVKVNAVVYFRVIDPSKAILQVEDYMNATSQLAQTTLRAILGKHELDEMLAERETLNTDIQLALDAQTDAWGIKVSNVEIKHVDIDETMVRAIAKQAEAERERRAKIIHAEGELQASEKLLAAAEVLAGKPQAMQLRYLQTLSNIAGDRTNTIVFPMPGELMNLLMRDKKPGE